MVPGLSLQQLVPGELCVAGCRGLDNHAISCLGEHKYLVSVKEKLSMSVPSAFPVTLPIREVNAGHDPII